MICDRWLNKCEITGRTDCYGIKEDCPPTIELKVLHDKMTEMLEEVNK